MARNFRDYKGEICNEKKRDIETAGKRILLFTVMYRYHYESPFTLPPTFSFSVKWCTQRLFGGHSQHHHAPGVSSISERVESAKAPLLSLGGPGGFTQRLIRWGSVMCFPEHHVLTRPDGTCKYAPSPITIRLITPAVTQGRLAQAGDVDRLQF